jgi:predicted helicase
MAVESNGFARLLERFESRALYTKQKGSLFEHAVKVYLKNEPKYRDELENVWLWEEWREVGGGDEFDPGHDYGVDLVARRKTGETIAIQAKFYDKGTSLPRNRLESFVSRLGTKQFDEGILVATVPTTAAASDLLREQSKTVHTITLHDLERSRVNWDEFFRNDRVELTPRQQLRDYQEAAVKDVLKGFKGADRGKLIMACGTGKTLTSLRLAEKMVGRGGLMLFLVPSLNLVSQTLRAWTQQAEIPLHSFAVCSDTQVGKRRGNGDPDDIDLHELEYPATTKAKSLGQALAQRMDDRHMRVVFGTYHSIDVIREAQKKYGMPKIDLLICDEAHRTTGRHVKGDEDEAAFMRVHNDAFIGAEKRLYMTATPKIWADNQKQRAENAEQVLYSMDDETQFGRTFHHLSFSDAVNKYQVLCDYRVVVLEVDEHEVAKHLQGKLAEDNSLVVDDAGKILGCWRALAKIDGKGRFADDPQPMRRAVAYAPVIDSLRVRGAPKASSTSGESNGSRLGPRKHFLGSRQYSDQFQAVVDEFRASEGKGNGTIDSDLKVHCEHVDGSMGAFEKNEKLDWLGAEPEPNTCRMLSNVRCLSEGVDVPALDAVLFLSPRKSIVEVVQTVGRVMRKAPGKRLGYVVIPVVVPFNADPNEVLDKNPAYEVVWEVLRALRAHDDKFEAMINRIDYEGRDDEKLIILRGLDRLPSLTGKRKSADKSHVADSAERARGSYTIGEDGKALRGEQGELQLIIQTAEKWDRALMARIVEKCGTRLYWSVWASDIAKIANTHVSRLTAILGRSSNREERAAFDEFLGELQRDINESISREEAIEMLAQHLVTRPVFEALFKDYQFENQNPVARAMNRVLATLEPHRLTKESAVLEAMYEAVRRRAEDTRTAKGRQALLAELYDKFFRSAFPKLSERLGIVYTPVEVVDFIIQSVDQVLAREFAASLAAEGVHILDPFVGTGTFITRLLQSGLISKERLAAKYSKEIHANEIVLLAYYIAAINIESAFYEAAGTGRYEPFPGICLTDTFNVGTDKGQQALALDDNSRRLRKQRQLDIRVVMANPPYSAGQDSANDFNANLKYPELDERIAATYAANSTATRSGSLYDSYIRALRWASDRIRDAGVIGFVTNAGWIDSNSADGLRKCLAEEFSSIYVFHLRGNQRTSGERSRREGGKIFGGGSRAPIAISLLVKNPKSKVRGEIFFHDIGDYLTREEKLRRIAELGSANGIAAGSGWIRIAPNGHHDWVNQRDTAFAEYISIETANGAVGLFANHSSGLLTARDAWCYNYSERELRRNIGRSVRFYNAEVKRWADATPKQRSDGLARFITIDPTKFSWDRQQRKDVERLRRYRETEDGYRVSLYRPFTRQHVYFARSMNNCVYRLPELFPAPDSENRVICLSEGGGKVAFSVLIADSMPSRHMVDIEGTQCFPLYLYEPVEDGDGASDQDHADSQGVLNLGSGGAKSRSSRQGATGRLTKDGQYHIREAITDEALARFREVYPGERIEKNDLFYYTYGLLHSEDYRGRYANNLSKELPRIPAVKRFDDFRVFTEAGEELAKLHLRFDAAKPYPADIEYAKKRSELTDEDYRVIRMRFGKPSGVAGSQNGSDLEGKWDRTTVLYNDMIKVREIPLEAYDYVVNGKSAIEWVMERQAVTTDKTTGIVNDANAWAAEQGNPKYPLELLLRVITVSLETRRIVRALPVLKV